MADLGGISSGVIDSLSFRFTGKDEARSSRGTAILASVENDYYGAKYAIDSDSKTEWRADDDGPYVIITFPGQTMIDRIFIIESKSEGYTIASVGGEYKVNITDASWTSISGVSTFPIPASGHVEFAQQLYLRQLKLTFTPATPGGYIGVRGIHACLQELFFMRTFGGSFETGNPASMTMQPAMGQAVHTTGLPCRVTAGKGKRDILNFMIPEVIGYDAVEKFEEYVEKQDEVGIITDTGRIFFGHVGSPQWTRNPTNEKYGETYNLGFSFVTVR